MTDLDTNFVNNEVYAYAKTLVPETLYTDSVAIIKLLKSHGFDLSDDQFERVAQYVSVNLPPAIFVANPIMLPFSSTTLAELVVNEAEVLSIVNTAAHHLGVFDCQTPNLVHAAILRAFNVGDLLDSILGSTVNDAQYHLLSLLVVTAAQKKAITNPDANESAAYVEFIDECVANVHRRAVAAEKIKAKRLAAVAAAREENKTRYALFDKVDSDDKAVLVTYVTTLVALGGESIHATCAADAFPNAVFDVALNTQGLSAKDLVILALQVVAPNTVEEQDDGTLTLVPLSRLPKAPSNARAKATIKRKIEKLIEEYGLDLVKEYTSTL